jgi:dTMP kinase
MYAARSQLLENVIKPALKQGQWVIGDRHDLSSRAYQGGGRGVNAELIESIRSITLKGFEPDLTLYLDVEPSVGLSRARGRGELDRIEVSGLAFFERVRKVYLEAADVDPKIKIINAMQPMDVVQQDALTVLKEFIQ